MSTAENRMREAFDALALPPDVKAATLAAIERAREDGLRECASPHPNAQTAQSGSSPSSAPDNVIAIRAAERTCTAKRTRRRWRLPLAAAACLVAAAFGFGGYTAYATETAVIGIEVNPSIELGINRFDTVVAARALNEDGEALLAEVSVVGDPYAEAIGEITASDAFASLNAADALIDVSIVCENDAQADALLQTSDDAIAACEAAGSCHRASGKEYEAASDAGMGVGRYAAAEELMALDPSISLGDCRAMTMREIIDAILAIDPDNDFAAERCGNGIGREQGAAQSADGSGSGSGNGTGSGGGQGHHYGRA